MENRNPDWYDIDDWSLVTEEKLRLILEQAEKCYEDVLSGYDGLKRRSEILAVIFIGFLISIGNYWFQNIGLEQIHSPANIAMIWMFGCLLCSMVILSKTLFCGSVGLQGTLASSMLNKQVAQSDIKEILQFIIVGTQTKIDKVTNIKETVADCINQATALGFATPIVGLVVYVVMKAWVF